MLKYLLIFMSVGLFVTACSTPKSTPVQNEIPSATPSDNSTQKLEPRTAMKIRPSSLAGSWYPKNAKDLTQSMAAFFDKAPKQEEREVHAIVVPHAGHVWSGATAAVAYKALPKRKYGRIFILCPNHRVPVRGAVSVSSDAFETPLGNVMVDRAFVDEWAQKGIIDIDDGAHRMEHAIEIQLPFLQYYFGEDLAPMVPIIVGHLTTAEARELGTQLKKALRNDDLVIISSDFLHYGENYDYVPFGEPVLENIRKYDERTIQAISKLDSSMFERFARDYPHSACGINALRVLAFAFENAGMAAHELAYDTSGHLSNSTDMSVSYVAMTITKEGADHTMEHFTDGPVSKENQKIAHEIVRRALKEAVNAQKETDLPADLNLGEDSDLFKKEYGVFVTLNEPNGQLRGCIGNIIPVANLTASLWGRAQDAALNDPRFDPVTPEELEHLEVEISVLTPMTPIHGPEDIVIGKHGVVLRKMGRSAVFLPQVAPEQGWNVEQMLTHLSMKAGLAPQAWRSGASFQVFEAQVF